MRSLCRYRRTANSPAVLTVPYRCGFALLARPTDPIRIGCAALLRSFSSVRTCGCESLRIAEEAERLRQLVILKLRKSRQTECPQLVTVTVERAPHAIIADGKGAHGACRCEEGNGTSRRTRRPSEESSCAIASESFSGAVGPIRYWQSSAVQCSAVQCSALIPNGAAQSAANPADNIVSAFTTAYAWLR